MKNSNTNSRNGSDRKTEARLANPVGTNFDRPILGAGKLGPGSYEARIKEIRADTYGGYDIVWQDEATGDTHIDKIHVDKWTWIRYRAALAPDLDCQKLLQSFGPAALKGCVAEIEVEWGEGWRLYKDSTDWCALDAEGKPLTDWMRSAEEVVEVMSGYPRAYLRISTIRGTDENFERIKKQCTP